TTFDANVAVPPVNVTTSGLMAPVSVRVAIVALIPPSYVLFDAVTDPVTVAAVMSAVVVPVLDPTPHFPPSAPPPPRPPPSPPADPLASPPPFAATVAVPPVNVTTSGLMAPVSVRVAIVALIPPSYVLLDAVTDPVTVAAVMSAVVVAVVDASV